jgi:hypothetical protein
VVTLLILELEAAERLATPTLGPSPQGGGRRRSRKIVELGHRTLSELPPPIGDVPSNTAALSSPSPLWGGIKGGGAPRSVADEEQDQK